MLRTLTFAVVTFASTIAGAAAPENLEIRFEAPEKVKVGETFTLKVDVKNTGTESIVVKEPTFDYRSFDFMVSFDGGKPSRYTKYHPNAQQPSTLVGQDLDAGDSVTFSHQVDAVRVGKWKFTPAFRGAGGSLEGEAKTVDVEPDGDATRALVRFETTKGEIEAEFWPDVAPATSLHIAELVRKGFYDGLNFHRTIKGFMIQGGCPEGKGTGGPGYSIEAEFNKKNHVAGVFSMARNGDPMERTGAMPRPQFANSAGSQFFLCDATAPHLNGKYTAFGAVVAGIEVVHAIASAPVEMSGMEASKPVDPVVTTKVALVVAP